MSVFYFSLFLVFFFMPHIKKAQVIQAGARVCREIGHGLEWSKIPNFELGPWGQFLSGGDFH